MTTLSAAPCSRYDRLFERSVFLTGAEFDECDYNNPAYVVRSCFVPRAVFIRFSLGGSEFRLATSDYSGHGGCQIGTVE